MPTPYVDSLIPRIRVILEQSDLSTVSAKAVRKDLISQGEDEATIRENRQAIDDEIGTIYEHLTGDADEASSTEDVPLTASSSRPPQSSPPEPLHRVKREEKAVVKREPGAPVKQERANGVVAADETDEQMAARLQREFDQLASRSRASRSTTEGAARPRKKAKAKKRSRATVTDSEGEGAVKKKRPPNPNNAFNKELILSDALGAFLGEERLSRPQTVKRIWDHIKERNLQDPSDKRMILCDTPMKEVFHTDRLHMFTMNKLLAQHFRNPAEVIYKEEPREVGLKAESREGGLKAEPRSVMYEAEARVSDGDSSLEDED